MTIFCTVKKLEKNIFLKRKTGKQLYITLAAKSSRKTEFETIRFKSVDLPKKKCDKKPRRHFWKSIWLNDSIRFRTFIFDTKIRTVTVGRLKHGKQQNRQQEKMKPTQAYREVIIS